MGVILVEVRVERNHSVAIWLYVLLREDVRHRMQRGLFPQTIWGEIVTDAWPLLVRLLTSYLLFSATRHFESKRKWFKKNLTRHRFIHCFFLFRSALLIWSWNGSWFVHCSSGINILSSGVRDCWSRLLPAENKQWNHSVVRSICPSIHAHTHQWLAL